MGCLILRTECGSQHDAVLFTSALVIAAKLLVCAPETTASAGSGGLQHVVSPREQCCRPQRQSRQGTPHRCCLTRTHLTLRSALARRLRAPCPSRLDSGQTTKQSLRIFPDDAAPLIVSSGAPDALLSSAEMPRRRFASQVRACSRRRLTGISIKNRIAREVLQ